ncbi:hypothetical protein FBU59_003293 [Linderina macrospora]|uniref:Uncharacterized protein n=1 Tax=Linderina macrospora TaxID=4868 RepID=A0ACC1J8Q5_9FUNG|nr:hypothetical protein FBU59_003293 [Linderina macrospora]
MRLMKNKRRLRIGKTDEGDDMEDIMFGDNLGLGKKAKLPVLKPVTITRFKGEVDDLPFDLGPNLGWFIDYPYDDETLKRATLVAT